MMLMSTHSMGKSQAGWQSLLGLHNDDQLLRFEKSVKTMVGHAMDVAQGFVY